MRVLVVGADLGGNVPPVRAVAAALAHRGAAVEVAGLPAPRGTAGDADETPLYQTVPFAPADAIAGRSRGQGSAGLPALVRLITGRSTSAATTALIRDRRPDVVAVDALTFASVRGALESGAPVVLLFHTFGGYWRPALTRGPAGAVLGGLGVRPDQLWDAADARLLLTDRDLDPGRDDPGLTAYEWTGSTERGAGPAPREAGARPRVLVSLSSTALPGMRGVYRRAIAALRALPVDAVVTTGDAVDPRRLDGAPRVEVRGWAPHAELLPGIDLVIGHGGHSTTMKALAHGVPLLVLPVNPTADQRLVGETLQAAGIGRLLPASSRPATVRATVRELLADTALRERAADTGRRLRALPDGAQTAADRILALATTARGRSG